MKEADTHNLMSDYEMPKDAEDTNKEPEDNTYYPHLKRQIYLNLIYDESVYRSMEEVDWRIKNYMSFDSGIGTYTPVLYVSDFWHLRKHLTELNETSIHELIHGKNKTELSNSTEEEQEELPHLRLHFRPYESYYYTM